MQPNAIQFPISDRMRLSQSQRGVSLVEILIAMSMIAILGGVDELVAMIRGVDGYRSEKEESAKPKTTNH